MKEKARFLGLDVHAETVQRLEQANAEAAQLASPEVQEVVQGLQELHGIAEIPAVTMRIALFGGTFDPPHRGHLAIAESAADAFHLDTVLFAPAGRQPLKPDSRSAPYADRFAMVTLACRHDPRFQPSSLDAPRPDGVPNYTVNTLTELHHLHPEATLFSIAGADSFLDLPRWREPDRLLELAEWIVVSRPGFALDDLASLHLTRQQHLRIHRLETVHEAISATDLRQRLRAGDLCTGLVPPEILDYISSHRLYC